MHTERERENMTPPSTDEILVPLYKVNPRVWMTNGSGGKISGNSIAVHISRKLQKVM